MIGVLEYYGIVNNCFIIFFIKDIFLDNVCLGVS